MNKRIIKFDEIILDYQKHKKKVDRYPSYNHLMMRFANFRLYFLEVADFVIKNKGVIDGGMWPDKVKSKLEGIMFSDDILKRSIKEIKTKRFDRSYQSKTEIEDELDEIREDIKMQRPYIAQSMVSDYVSYLETYCGIDFRRDYGDMMPENLYRKTG